MMGEDGTPHLSCPKAWVWGCSEHGTHPTLPWEGKHGRNFHRGRARAREVLSVC